MDEKVLQDRISIFDDTIKLLARSANEMRYMHQNSHQRVFKIMTELKSRVKRIQHALWSCKNRESRIREERERSIAEIELLNKQEQLLEMELSVKQENIVKIESDLQYLHQEIKKRKHLISIRAAFVSNLEETQNKKEAVRYILSGKNECLKKAILEEGGWKQSLQILQSKRSDQIISSKSYETEQEGEQLMGGHKCMKDTKKQQKQLLEQKQSALEEAVVENCGELSCGKEHRTSMSPSSVQHSLDKGFNDLSAGIGQNYCLKDPPHLSFLETLENRERAAMKIQRGWRKDRYKELALLNSPISSNESNDERELVNTTKKHSRRHSQKRKGSREEKDSNSNKKRKKNYVRNNVPVSNFSCFGHALGDLCTRFDVEDGCVNILIPRTTNSNRRVRRVDVFGNL
jgi:hypothetical protein